MPADTSVHFFHSGLPGAPVLNNTPGSLIAVLDACLVNGFGAGVVDGVTISGGVATVTRGAGHSAEVGSVVLISGATVSGGSINGEQRVLTAANGVYTFDATGIPNQTATGTITQRLAPAGWAKAFSGTNLAAYRAPDVTGTRFYFRVDDTGTQDARVRGYEAMTDVNTGTGLFPSAAATAGSGLFWAKSLTGATSPWIVVADGKTFYFCGNHMQDQGTRGYSSQGFGDCVRVGSADSFAAFLTGGSSSRVGSLPGFTDGELDYTPINQASFVFARSFHGIGGFVLGGTAFASPRASTGGAMRSGLNNVNFLPFPNPSDGGIYVSSISCYEASSSCLRGSLPGFFAFPQNIGDSVLPSLGYLTGVAGFPGKTFRTIPSQNGVYALDMSGPWQ
jgi:hypothetical protein